MVEGIEQFRARGNALADEAAKEAVRLHPEAPKDVDLVTEYWLARAETVTRTTARAMAMFPPMGARLTKLRHGSLRPRRRRLRQGDATEGTGDRAENVHEWEFRGGRWRCSKCAALHCAPELNAQAKRRRCNGTRAQLEIAKMEERGHAMALAEATVPFAICLRCGAWVARRAYGRLRQSCEAASASGRQAIRRLARGLPPWAVTGRSELMGNSAAVIARWSTVQGWVTANGLKTEMEPATEDLGDRDADAQALHRRSAGEAGGSTRGPRSRLDEVKARIRSRLQATKAAAATALVVRPVELAATGHEMVPADGGGPAGGRGKKRDASEELDEGRPRARPKKDAEATHDAQLKSDNMVTAAVCTVTRVNGGGYESKGRGNESPEAVTEERSPKRQKTWKGAEAMQTTRGGNGVGEAAPATPVDQHCASGGDAANTDWVVRGCGCNGRMHEECTRLYVPMSNKRGVIYESGAVENAANAQKRLKSKHGPRDVARRLPASGNVIEVGGSDEEALREQDGGGDAGGEGGGSSCMSAAAVHERTRPAAKSPGRQRRSEPSYAPQWKRRRLRWKQSISRAEENALTPATGCDSWP